MVIALIHTRVSGLNSGHSTGVHIGRAGTAEVASQFLDTFCTKPKVGQKQQLSISLEATAQTGDNVFLGTLDFPGPPTTGPATSMVMPETPSESVAKVRGRGLDKFTRKLSSSDNSHIPSKKPQGDSFALRVSFANASYLTLSTQHSGRLLSSLLTSQSPLTQLGRHPLAGHSSSGTDTPPQPLGDLKTLDKMCNKVTQLWAAYRDWIQGTLQFWDKEIVARIELSLFLQTLVSQSLGHMQDMREAWAHRGQQELSPETLGELELCLQSPIIHYVAEHHQGLSKRGQEAFIVQRKALEDTEASCHQCISGCLNRLHLLTAEQAELKIYLSLLLPAPVGTEVLSLDGSTFPLEPLLQMVPSVYPVGTVTTLPPASGHIPAGPVQIVEDNTAM